MTITLLIAVYCLIGLLLSAIVMEVAEAHQDSPPCSAWVACLLLVTVWPILLTAAIYAAIRRNQL